MEKISDFITSSNVISKLDRFLILFATDAYDKIMNGDIELNTGVSNINGNFIAVLMNVTNTTTTAWQPICNGFYDKSYFTCNWRSVICVKACSVKIYFSSGSIIGNNVVQGYLSINGTTKANISSGNIHVNTYSLKDGDIVQAFNCIERTGRNAVIGTLAIELV